ncbi:MAG: L,D-transpeptidase, partial [Bryobacteraceae bacterium]
ALATALLLAAEGRAAGSNNEEGTQGTGRRADEERCNEEPPQRRLVVSLADRKLAVLVNGEVTRLYDVAIGANRTPSPTGRFQVINRIPKPTWWGPNGVVPPGKSNPLGSRWMGLSKRGYGIHGTNHPRSIGKAASHGCIRMRNADAEALFEWIETGDVVELVREPDERLARILRPRPEEESSAAPAAVGTGE